MQFRRRKQRFCQGCGELLVKRPTESVETFLSRRTCNSDCTKAARLKQRPNSSSLCFCGAQRKEGSPFCSWDCRLISIKCTEWNIPLNINAYREHERKLTLQQLDVDKAKKNVDLAVWLELRQGRN